jgi:hypothetical protein
VCWIAEYNYGIEHIVHLLDDFLTDAPSCIHVPERNMALLSHICAVLKIPTTPHKTIGPAQLLEFLGILLDSINMRTILPDAKIARIHNMIENTMAKEQ